MEKVEIGNGDHVWYVDEREFNGYRVYDVGFYYVDETGDLVGPYDNLAACRIGLFAYAKELSR